RGVDQNAEFMAGDILMTAILPESDGSSENWNDEQVAGALQGAFGAGIAYQETFGTTPMHIIFRSEELVPTPHEPIQTGMDEHYIWVMDLMDELGIPGMQDDILMTHEYNNRQRRYYQADWAFTAFVANSEHAPNHRFADQWYTAYANLGGPYMVMPYPAGENPYDVDPILVYSTVYQHEMAHIFWALDEYPAEFNLSTCGSHSGYLSFAHRNKVTRAIDGTLLFCPGHEVELCIMWRAKEDLGRPVCTYTAGQIGVIDNNGNNIPDVYDMPPTVEFETARVETVQSPDVTINMTAISLPVENRNPFQDDEARMSYAAPLADAWLTVNGVGPVYLDPLDDAWDEVEEDLTLALKGIPVGVTDIAVTVRNVAGRDSEPMVKSIYFAGIQYALFDVDIKEEGINLSWSTVGDEFDTRLDLHRIDASSGSLESTVLASDMEPKAEHSLYKLFEFFDTDVEPGNEYKYFVRGYFTMEYPDTTIEYKADSHTYSARSMFPISPNSLTSNVAPNPFRDVANISVRVPASVTAGQSGGASASIGSVPVRTDVEIRVYDVAGRFVKEVYRGRQYGGVQTFTWDGTNANNERVPSGIYFVKTVAGAASEVKKVVLVR
ncbi:MAG: T9SS type A sorting domain-containing protein, partial [Candidatus Latescibacterota bacterium]